MKQCLFMIIFFMSFNVYSMECSIKKISTALALPAEKIGCLKKSVERTQEGISGAIIKYKCTDLVTGLCNLLCRDESDFVCASRIFKAIPKYSDEKIGACGYFWGPVTDLFNTRPKGHPDVKCVHAYNDYISGFTDKPKVAYVKETVVKELEDNNVADNNVADEELRPVELNSDYKEVKPHNKVVPVRPKNANSSSK